MPAADINLASSKIPHGLCVQYAQKFPREGTRLSSKCWSLLHHEDEAHALAHHVGAPVPLARVEVQVGGAQRAKWRQVALAGLDVDEGAVKILLVNAVAAQSVRVQLHSAYRAILEPSNVPLLLQMM